MQGLKAQKYDHSSDLFTEVERTPCEVLGCEVCASLPLERIVLALGTCAAFAEFEKRGVFEEKNVRKRMNNSNKAMRRRALLDELVEEGSCERV